MPEERHSAEQIINKLREAEVALSQGQNVKAVCKKIGVTEQTYTPPQGRGARTCPTGRARTYPNEIQL